MKPLLPLLLITWTFICHAQENGGRLPHGRWCYDFTEDLLKDNTLTVKTDTAVNWQHICWALSYINDYKTDLAYWDSTMGYRQHITSADSLNFLQCKPQHAIDYILKRAATAQIVIINEAHHQPNHRVFTEALLPGLYKLGYHYFGAEAIDYNDTLLNERGYAALVTGQYVHQPQYGNLITTALQQGYHVFAYEATGQYGDPQQREIIQAKNIKKILDKDPKAKIMVHCGYGHIGKSEAAMMGVTMAGRVKELTGIDPFTIDQVDLTETGHVVTDNPCYKMVNLNYYAVFADTAGNMFNGNRKPGDPDVCVYHPRSKYVAGRPNWYFENGREPCHVKDSITVGYPCLLFAYPVDQNPTIATPTDVIELKGPGDKTALALKKGNYIIVARNRAKREQYFMETF